MKGKQNRKFKEPPLQPLRIPAGWVVKWNTFFEVEPMSNSWDQVRWHFGEDMLYVENDWVGVAIDLGWYPSYRSTGRFGLLALRLEKIHKLAGMAWDKPERELRTRSKEKVVRTLERWMEWYCGEKMRAASKNQRDKRKEK